jgi:hypothetical protein
LCLVGAAKRIILNKNCVASECRLPSKDSSAAAFPRSAPSQ